MLRIGAQGMSLSKKVPWLVGLNPDELLNQDVKANACHNRLIYSTQQLKSDLLSSLRPIQKTPSKVQNFFLKPSGSYAS